MPDEEGLTDQLVLAPNYLKESQMIAIFLTDGMKRPSHMSPKAWRTIRKNALNYVVRGKVLFRRADRTYSTRRVVDDPEERARILEALHDDSGHKGRETIYRRVADRYYWD